MARSSEQRKNKKQTKRRPLEKFRTLSAGGARHGMIDVLGRLGCHLFWQYPEKEEGDSAIPSSQRQAVRDRGHGPNGEEVVVDTSQVVVGTSQKGEEAVGCQPIRPCEEEEKEG